MIAIFDSGYGGVTVLKSIIEALPQYDYLYFGDSARAPYGNHSSKIIRSYSEQAVEMLFDRGAVLIIFACNTTSSVALRHVQKKYLKGKSEKERKILGVLIPVAEKAVSESKNKHIAVVGTIATVRSGAYETEIKKISPEISVYQQACPLLVPYIEQDLHHSAEALSTLDQYLEALRAVDVDTLILGCTHYPLMAAQFAKSMGKEVKILESGPISAESLKEYLRRHPEIERRISRHSKLQFMTSGDPLKFESFIKEHFNMKIETPEKVSLP